MSHFIDAAGHESMGLVPGGRTLTFWAEQMLFSLVEVDANSEGPLHTHSHEQGRIIVEGELQMALTAMSSC